MVNDFFDEYANRTKAEYVVEIIIMTLIILTAILGNIIVVLAVFRNKTLRTTPNIYLVALAFSDILMASVCMTLSLHVIINPTWVPPYSLCQFQGFFAFCFAFTSLQFMTAMAINRYYRVVKSSRYSSLFTVQRTLISVVAIIINASFGAGLHLVSGWATYSFHYGKVVCFPVYKTQNLEKGYIAFLDIVYIGTPVLIISICYFFIFKTVRQHKKNMLAHKNNKNIGIDAIQTTINVEEVRITKTLFVTVLGFVTCWTPVAMIDLIDVSTSYSMHIPRQVYLMYIYLAFGSSSINPFIYGILNRYFRREFLRIFTFKWKGNVDIDPVVHNELPLPARAAFVVKLNSVVMESYSTPKEE